MADAPVVARVAAALADEERISWEQVARLTRTPGEAAMVRELRNISALSARVDSSPATLPVVRLPVSLAAWLLVAAVQCVAAILAFAGTADTRFRPAQALLVVAFGSAALILRVGGRADGRAQWLMAVYLLTGSSFAHPLLGSTSGPAATLRPLQWLALDSLMPYALWRFAQIFPYTERFTWVDRAARRLSAVALGCGVLLALNTLLLVAIPSLATSSLALVGRDHPGRMYWNIIYPLALAALVVAALHTWRAAPAERKRVSLFVLAFVAGATPLLAKGILEMTFPAWSRSTIDAVPLKSIVDLVVLGSLMLVPLATTYAVLARQALSVRVVLHRATKYLLARWAVLVLASVPALALGRYIYVHRDQSLAQLVVEGRGAFLAGWLVAALILVAVRRPLAAIVDRRFRRAAINHHQVVAESMRAIREATNAPGVAAAVAREIGRVFGTHVGVLQYTPAGAVPLHGDVAPIAATSALLAIAHDRHAPSIVGARSRIFALLPAPDRAWITATDTDLLLPLHRADGQHVALVAGGAKPSGLGWTADDLTLLETMGQAAGLAFDNTMRQAEGLAAPAQAEPWDVECVRCGTITRGATPACACGGAVQPSLLPAVLHGKFAVERRIGAGGMGVVYRGRDLTLDRTVALKTLPDLHAGAVHRMRDEARAMASVMHPHLALIFGAELWHHTPVLVIELLDGGTLMDRLRRDGPVPIEESIALARSLAEGLDALHGAGLLHGDIKPSNIGFTRSGVPKLLDFGLARLIGGSPSPVPGSLSDGSVSTLAGTLIYLPPEAAEALIAALNRDPRMRPSSAGALVATLAG